MDNSKFPLELYPSGYLLWIEPPLDFPSVQLQFLAIDSCPRPLCAVSAGYPLPKGTFPAGNHSLSSTT